MTPQPPGNGHEPLPKITEGRADRSISGLAGIGALCRAALYERTLEHVAYYIRGNQQIWMDVFDDGGLLEPSSPDEAEQKRERLLVSGQQLNYVVSRLDKAFEPVRSGRLIRCVFDVGDGALFYYSPFPGEYLVGAASDAARVESADVTMVGLCDRVRLARGWGGTQNPAGEHTRYEVEVDDDDLVDEARYIEEAAPAGPRPELGEHLRLALDPEALHYVSYFEGPQQVCSADLLRHPALASLTVGTDPVERREHYARIGKLTYLVNSRVDRMLLPLLGGVLRRVVLDVEAGALYYRRLGEEDALIGVTLDQAKVAVAEEKIGLLALSLVR